MIREFTHECACGRPSQDAMLCFRCEHQLKAALAAIFTYHGLAYDLDVALAKQAQFAQQSGPSSDEEPILFNERAGTARDALKNTLVGWARIIHSETGAELPRDTVPAIAAWLHKHVGWVRHHEDAAEAHDEITDAVRAVRIAIDRPLEQIYVGPCDCGAHMFARLGNVYVTCPSIEEGAHERGRATWSIADRVEWLLAQAEDVIATAATISTALTHYNRPVTPAAIRGHVRRERLWPVGYNHLGVALYRLGDVMDLITPSTAPADKDAVLTLALLPDALARHGHATTRSLVRGLISAHDVRAVWCTDPTGNRMPGGGAALYQLGDVLESIVPAVPMAMAA